MAAHAQGASHGTPRMLADEVTQVLRGVPLFAVLGEDGLAATARVGSTRTYGAGQIICHQGDPGDRLYVVLHGLVKVVFGSERGDEIVLRTLGAEEVFGELALLDGSPRSASVVAVESTLVFMLLRERLLELMRQHPRIADEFLRLLGQLVRRLTEQAGDLVFLDLPGRLAKLLLQLVGQHGAAGGAVLDRGLTQSDLAAMIGASRPAVNRALQSLATRGYLTVQGQVITLRNVEGLRRRAEVVCPERPPPVMCRPLRSHPCTGRDAGAAANSGSVPGELAAVRIIGGVGRRQWSARDPPSADLESRHLVDDPTAASGHDRAGRGSGALCPR